MKRSGVDRDETKVRVVRAEVGLLGREDTGGKERRRRKEDKQLGTTEFGDLLSN